jgi:putative oxidoreductase
MGSFNHFKNLNYMSEYAKARGTPSPKLAVAGTEIILLLGSLSMLLGVYPVVGIILLIVFLLGVSFQKGGRRANEADRHDQLHEEYGACGGTLAVLAATASVADESRDRVGHTHMREVLDREGWEYSATMS